MPIIDDKTNPVKVEEIIPNIDNTIKNEEKIPEIYSSENVENNKSSDYVELALNVIRGDFGNGQERDNNLLDLGYTKEEIHEIQDIVNRMLDDSSASVVIPSKTNEEVALDVINGLYGSGEERTFRLRNEGYNVEEIQNIVNKLS